jgi:hypothetical protein
MDDNPDEEEPPDEEAEGDEERNGDRDETTPSVELELYQLSVRVSGQASDATEDVEATAQRLMDYLVDQAEALEDEPDDRGLG